MKLHEGSSSNVSKSPISDFIKRNVLNTPQPKSTVVDYQKIKAKVEAVGIPLLKGEKIKTVKSRNKQI